MPRASARERSSSPAREEPERRSTMVVMPSFFNSARASKRGCAPRKSCSETFPALGTPRTDSFSAKEIEVDDAEAEELADCEEPEDAEGVDCRNGTDQERKRNARSKAGKKSCIQN